MDNNRDVKQQAGLIISEEVIATIASNAALEVDGVAGMVAKPVDIKGVFKKSGSAAKSVSFFSNESRTVIDVFISVKNGARIPEVAANVQQAVKDTVQNMTGYAVTKVNVHIADIALRPAVASAAE